MKYLHFKIFCAKLDMNIGLVLNILPFPKYCNSIHNFEIFSKYTFVIIYEF